MRKYSPTSVGMFDRHCPKAFDFYSREKEPKEYELAGPEPAELGIVFHSCVHQAGFALKDKRDPAAALEAVATALATKMPPTLVKEAADHAKDFCEWWEFSTKMEFEHGVAFDPTWNKVEWDSEARRIRYIMDAVGVLEQDFDGEILKVGVGQDYKTGWGASAKDLDSIQMDLYVVGIYELFKDKIDAIQIEIVASKYHRVFSKLFILQNEEDYAEIQSRRSRIEFAMKAADESPLKPRVGPGCLLCRYANECDAFNAQAEHLAKHGFQMQSIESNPEQAARDYAVMERRYKDLGEQLKQQTKVHGPIEVDGQTLAYHETVKRALKDTKYLLWMIQEAHPDLKFDELQLSALTSALSLMEPGVTQWEKLAKKLGKMLGHRTQKAAVAALEPDHVTGKPIFTFGWKKTGKEK